LAKVGRPISSLISKASPFIWREEQVQSFNYIKEQLTSYPVVKRPDWAKRFIINLSTSEHAMAAVLIQNDDSGRVHLVYYARRLLTTYEFKYSSLEKQAVALLYAYNKFKHYLLSIPFSTLMQCEIDCLKQLVQQTNLEGRVARLMAALQAYDLEIKTVKGTRAKHANLLLELGEHAHEEIGVLSDDVECCSIRVAPGLQDFGYNDIINYLRDLMLPDKIDAQQCYSIQ